MKKYRRKYQMQIPTPNTDTDPALISFMKQIPLYLTHPFPSFPFLSSLYLPLPLSFSTNPARGRGGSAVSFSSRVWGRATAEIEFCAF